MTLQLTDNKNTTGADKQNAEHHPNYLGAAQRYALQKSQDASVERDRRCGDVPLLFFANRSSSCSTDRSSIPRLLVGVAHCGLPSVQLRQTAAQQADYAQAWRVIGLENDGAAIPFFVYL